MKHLILIFLLSISLSSGAQTSMSSEISSEGKASVKIKPDIAILFVSVRKENPIEKNAIRELNEEVQKLLDFLKKLGFSEKHIKISGYEIEASTYSDNKNYTATNRLRIEFGLNNKLLDAFYAELQNGNYNNVDVDFNTELSVDKEKAAREQLVQLAIKDARKNAENIAMVLAVKLKGVKTVSKFNQSAEFRRVFDEVKSSPAAAAMEAPPATIFSKYEVQELELEENITIVYEISKG